MSLLGDTLRELLTQGKGDRPAALAESLQLVLKEFDCVAGTIHHWNAGTEKLDLTVSHHIPPPVIEKIRSIPIGKGMAGIAAERQSPVQVCNLQEDSSGVVRPGAKETKMEGSIACPILVDSTLR